MDNENSQGETKVDQTIQWARESLQRRRSELLEKKKHLIASYKNDEATTCTSSAATATDNVHAMLERGRVLLREAEAHSEILGQYASSSDNAAVDQSAPSFHNMTDSKNGPLHHSTQDDFMTRFLQETNSATDNRFDKYPGDSASSRRIVSGLPVEMPDWDNECGENHQEPGQNFDRNEELQELLQEGEARARLDELIATVRRQGDGPLNNVELDETPTKRISSFDPSSLKAAKRAALKKIKWDEEVAAAEEEARLLTSFKALPLPGGAEVKNNLFASTQSFQGKQIGSVEKLVRRDTKCDLFNDAHSSISGTCGTFDNISVVSSKTSHDNSFSFSGYQNEADRERATQLRMEKRMKKRLLLDAVNQRIVGEIPSSVEDDAITDHSDGGDIIEDPSQLRQDIARLGARLKQKRTQRLATLNDIVDIDLDALFERLLSGEAGENAKHIIDRLKNQVCGSANDFQCHVLTNAKKNGECGAESEQKRRSLFRRHEDWAKAREQKLFDARLQLEAEAMNGITGIPELSHATRSWRKAKESHNETLKRFAKVEERKHQEKESKERATNQMKQKEMEELKKHANSKLKSMKSEVNKEEQMKRLDKLSKPRQIREVPNNVDDFADMAYCEQQQPNITAKSKIFLPATPKRKANSLSDGRIKSKEKSAKNSNSTSDQKPDEFCGKPSFSEMSDKDFAKLVKRISKKATTIGNPES
ncbi:hypothetical protein ACHAXR_003510 [Thalassiosira sp. AJA248-18]